MLDKFIGITARKPRAMTSYPQLQNLIVHSDSLWVFNLTRPIDCHSKATASVDQVLLGKCVVMRSVVVRRTTKL